MHDHSNMPHYRSYNYLLVQDLVIIIIISCGSSVSPSVHVVVQYYYYVIVRQLSLIPFQGPPCSVLEDTALGERTVQCVALCFRKMMLMPVLLKPAAVLLVVYLLLQSRVSSQTTSDVKAKTIYGDVSDYINVAWGFRKQSTNYLTASFPRRTPHACACHLYWFKIRTRLQLDLEVIASLDGLLSSACGVTDH